MINDLKHLGNPPKPVPWNSVVKLVIILAVLVWMGERDREQSKDNQALAEVVYAQAQIIDTMQCGAGLEMSMPIEVRS
jgi:hypothetical protein